MKKGRTPIAPVLKRHVSRGQLPQKLRPAGKNGHSCPLTREIAVKTAQIGQYDSHIRPRRAHEHTACVVSHTVRPPSDLQNYAIIISCRWWNCQDGFFDDGGGHGLG